MTPPAVLFDLDGTLVDSIELIRRSFRHACEQVLPAPHPDEERWLAGVGTPLRTQMRAVAASDEEADALIAAYRAFQVEHHDRLLGEYAGVREMLAGLHAAGHPMALVTSKADALAARALAHTRLDVYLRAVVGCDSCTRHKPDPEPVRVALERLGAPAAGALFVGDSPHDIAAGNAAGVTSVGVLWGPFSRHDLERAGAAHLVERPADLAALVRRLQAA